MSDDTRQAVPAEAVDAIGDLMWSAGYNRGLDIATSRAESRAALGLPIERNDEYTAYLEGGRFRQYIPLSEQGDPPVDY